MCGLPFHQFSRRNLRQVESVKTRFTHFARSATQPWKTRNQRVLWAPVAADGTIRVEVIHRKLERLREMQMARGTRIAGYGSAGTDSGSSSRFARKGVFRREGEYWTVGYGGNTFRLKDTKGLGYLAHLLRHPAVEFHVLDLFGGIAGQREDDDSTQGLPRGPEDLEKAGIHISGLGDAGAMLDDQAKVAYRHRLSELREELEGAKEAGNIERAEHAEEEIDALTRELSRAVGLGGRNRRAASASERARQTITKTIKSVVERIAQSDRQLADILSRCIRTGTYCSYQPDPDFPIAWEFAAPIVEPAAQPTTSGDPAPTRADRPQAPSPVLYVSPFSLAERTAFEGRETERGAIRAVIDRALSNRGSVIMLGGGPGVGKTRLAMEMAEYASRVGFRSVVGHCYERDEPYPFLPWVEILESGLAQAASLDDYRRRMGDNAAELAQIAPSLRRVFPDMPQPLDLPPAQKRRHLFQALSEALAYASQTRSYFFVLEDLHWADESTLALLNHLANRVAQLPVVIVGTYRDLDSENDPALTRTLEELIRQGIRPLKLAGLSRDAVVRMLHGLSKREVPESLVSFVFDQTQGNPFFVEEVYRHLIEEGKVFDAAGQFRTDITIDEIDVPENVRLIIGRRLERLDENEKRMLEAAAVIGRSFSFQLLTGISQIDVDELFTVIEKAQQMGIVVPSAEGPERPFTFGHELVRQTLLGGISAPRQQRLHASVAEAIERLYPGAINERAGEIAHHLLKAGSFADNRRLVRYLTLAGKSALEAAAFDEARSSFQSALSHLTDVDVRERADLLASIATAERGLERWEVAFANLGDALEIYIALGDREMIARSCSELAVIFIWAGRLHEAAETARRGLRYLEADVSAGRARLLAILGETHASAGIYEPAHAAVEEGLNIASQLSDPNLMGALLAARSVVNYFFLRLREAAADGEKARGSEAPPWDGAVHLQVLCQTFLMLGRMEEGVRLIDELEPLAAKIGQSYSIARCLITRAWVEFGQAPDLSKLEAVLQQLLKSDPKVSFVFWDVFSRMQLSLVDFFQGNWDSALFHAQESFRLEVQSSILGSGVGTLFRQMAYAGDRAGALAILDEKREWMPRSGQANTSGSWSMLALVIEGLAVLGEHCQAGQLYPLARELVDTGAVVLWPVFRFTHTIAGIAAASARQWKAAEDHFQTALEQAESIPHRLEQAEIRRFHAMMLLDRAAPGDREKARELLGEARETYTSIGMHRHIEMTQTLLD
jgi:tetratricopeptide (TPR) repeat protein